jgi:hypothetical protein
MSSNQELDMLLKGCNILLQKNTVQSNPSLQQRLRNLISKINEKNNELQAKFQEFTILGDLIISNPYDETEDKFEKLNSLRNEYSNISNRVMREFDNEFVSIHDEYKRIKGSTFIGKTKKSFGYGGKKRKRTTKTKKRKI